MIAALANPSSSGIDIIVLYLLVNLMKLGVDGLFSFEGFHCQYNMKLVSSLLSGDFACHSIARGVSFRDCAIHTTTPTCTRTCTDRYLSTQVGYYSQLKSEACAIGCELLRVSSRQPLESRHSPFISMNAWYVVARRCAPYLDAAIIIACDHLRHQ